MANRIRSTKYTIITCYIFARITISAYPNQRLSRSSLFDREAYMNIIIFKTKKLSVHICIRIVVTAEAYVLFFYFFSPTRGKRLIIVIRCVHTWKISPQSPHNEAILIYVYAPVARRSSAVYSCKTLHLVYICKYGFARRGYCSQAILVWR